MRKLILIAENTDEFLKKIMPYDKALHIAVGFFASAFLIVLCKKFNINTLYIIYPVGLLATCKEFYDYYIRMSKFDLLDIVYTIIPAIILLIITK